MSTLRQHRAAQVCTSGFLKSPNADADRRRVQWALLAAFIETETRVGVPWRRFSSLSQVDVNWQRLCIARMVSRHKPFACRKCCCSGRTCSASGPSLPGVLKAWSPRLSPSYTVVIMPHWNAAGCALFSDLAFMYWARLIEFQRALIYFHPNGESGEGYMRVLRLWISRSAIMRWSITNKHVFRLVDHGARQAGLHHAPVVTWAARRGTKAAWCCHAIMAGPAIWRSVIKAARTSTRWCDGDQ